MKRDPEWTLALWFAVLGCVVMCAMTIIGIARSAQ